MKKIFTILLISIFCHSMLLAQDGYLEDKTEYRYPNFVVGLSHSFMGSLGESSDALYIHTDQGDIPQEKKGFTYTPGFHVGVVYNIDLKNNKTGLLTGIEFVNYGFANKYQSIEDDNLGVKKGDYTATSTFRALGVQIPIMFKFGTTDIYRDMHYGYIGIKPVVNLSVKKGDKGSWTDDKIAKAVDGKSTFSVAATLGFNYNILSFSVNYMFMELVDSKYEAEGGKKPFDGIKGHIYICTSLNVPMTRWITIHNWTAESIRRKLHNGKTL